ncbi:MAG: hypothetical protein AAFX04_08405 [Pseudomonadota bacterium]
MDWGIVILQTGLFCAIAFCVWKIVTSLHSGHFCARTEVVSREDDPLLFNLMVIILVSVIPFFIGIWGATSIDLENTRNLAVCVALVCGGLGGLLWIGVIIGIARRRVYVRGYVFSRDSQPTAYWVFFMVYFCTASFATLLTIGAVGRALP